MPKAEEPSLRKGFLNYFWNAIDCFQSVAATKTPIIFLGTGEHLTDLDRFSPQPFISKLLGLGDVQGLMEHMQDLATQNPDRQKEMAKKLEEGKLSIRDWREQIQNVMNLYVAPVCPLLSRTQIILVGDQYQKLHR
jgi:signal recognition particle GTPase